MNYENTLTSVNCHKWLEIITSGDVKIIGNQNGLIIDEIKKTHPNGNTETTNIESIDGEIPKYTTYNPYDLKVNFLYRGADKDDVNMYIFKLNNILSKREPYYVRHSDLPDIKYAVLPNPKIESSKVTIRDYKITVTFECYKGYSESYNTVQNMNLTDGTWQFEEGLMIDDEISYNKEECSFMIYNGSYDTIDPLLNHYLKIKLKLNAPRGFKIINNSTQDIVEFNSPITKKDIFELRGVYPYLNNERVGRYTNYEWIRLKPGYNYISIHGDTKNRPITEWDFNYLFR